MIPSLNLNNYYKIASMSQSLNSYIQEAMLAKAELGSSMMDFVTNYPPDIGGKVDLYA